MVIFKCDRCGATADGIIVPDVKEFTKPMLWYDIEVNGRIYHACSYYCIKLIEAFLKAKRQSERRYEQR